MSLERTAAPRFGFLLVVSDGDALGCSGRLSLSSVVSLLHVASEALRPPSFIRWCRMALGWCSIVMFQIDVEVSAASAPVITTISKREQVTPDLMSLTQANHALLRRAAGHASCDFERHFPLPSQSFTLEHRAKALEKFIRSSKP